MKNLVTTHCPNEETCKTTCFTLEGAELPHHFEDRNGLMRLVLESAEDCQKRIDHILNHQK